MNRSRLSLGVNPVASAGLLALGAALSGGRTVAGQTSPGRPLRIEPGVVVVSAINDAVLKKDYEAVETVWSIDANGVRSGRDWAIPDRQSPGGVRRLSAESLQRPEDREHARRLILWYMPGDPETFPGATGPAPSSDVFNDIKTKGSASVVVGAVSQSDGQGLGLLGGLFAGRKYFRGTINRIGTEAVRVMVDGVPTALNAVHARGTVTVAGDQGDVEFWWVDDPATRFALRFRFQGSLSQVVRIDRPTRADTIQQGLAGAACRSEVPGIYFLSDSAELLPASKPAIERIAALLTSHPDWKVTIEGHTDNTGSAQHNLDLSRRRAEALKAELTSKHGLHPARVLTAGYGQARPVDTNETMDGRAHNRRVEISRRCRSDQKEGV